MNLLIKTALSPEQLKMFGIYGIVCIPTGKLYIGQTRTFFLKRFLEHQGLLINNRHNAYFQKAFNKYGIENFECIILETCELDRKQCCEWLNAHEIYWIRYYRKLFGQRHVYNLNDGGGGINPTPESRKRRSESLKRFYANPENRERIRMRARARAEMLRYDITYHKHLSAMQILAILRDPTIPIRRGYKIREHYNKPGAREKQGAAMRKRYANPNERRKISEAVSKRNKEHPEVLIQQGESLRKFYEEDPERRKRKGEEIRRRFTNPDERHKISEGVKRRNKEHPEIIEKQRVGVIRNYAENPNTRKQQSESHKKHYKEHPERRKRSAEIARTNWNNEELRERMQRKIKATYAKPEVRAKILNIRRESARKRTEKYLFNKARVDFILTYHYVHHPEDINLSVRMKLRLINTIAIKHTEWFINT